MGILVGTALYEPRANARQGGGQANLYLGEPLAGFADFAISREGTLAYAPDRPTHTRLHWVDRDGRSEPLTHEVALFVNPRISPDGERIAIRKLEAQREVWILEIARGTMPG